MYNKIKLNNVIKILHDRFFGQENTNQVKIRSERDEKVD